MISGVFSGLKEGVSRVVLFVRPLVTDLISFHADFVGNGDVFPTIIKAFIWKAATFDASSAARHQLSHRRLTPWSNTCHVHCGHFYSICHGSTPCNFKGIALVEYTALN